MQAIIYLIRHGETDWNRQGKIQGHIDIPLNEIGLAQGKRLLPIIRGLKIKYVLSSDLIRAQETAHAFAKPLGLGIELDTRLREIHLGDLQGRTFESLGQRLSRIPLSDQEVVKLNGEKGSDVLKRSKAAIEDYIFNETELRNEVAIVSHGGVIRRIIHMIVGGTELPPPVGNGAIYPLRLEKVIKHDGSHEIVWTLLDFMDIFQPYEHTCNEN